ncbi:RnfABCDGE type electron transport complex subunit B [Vibrio sp. WXL103]|uniref:RnfABCDGE type electron transport complex subunit B n=1 Tax=Vibrio sp. WXL103 TaxID=3450710 RepID=UPI003EC652BA
MVSVIFFILLGAALGAALGYAAIVFRVEGNPIADKIEDMMPGSQCGQCGEPGCRQAAEAMAQGTLSPDSCPSAGQDFIAKVAEMLGISVADKRDEPQIAYITESQCSGCTRCFKACPYDAIVGANKQMHTVIQRVCTGCGVCVEVCPQGCLQMQAVKTSAANWYWPNPDQVPNQVSGQVPGQVIETKMIN